MISHPAAILGVLLLNVVISEWLARRTLLRHAGSALVVIVLTAIAANAGLIPAYGDGVEPYGVIFSQIAPLAIFLLLLRVQLRGLLQAGGPMVVLFMLGALGTTAGVVAGMVAVGGESALGERYAALGAMFVGTYTGGSVNFNAMALHYGVNQDGSLYAGSALVDSAMTTIWMAATVALPRVLRGLWTVRVGEPAAHTMDAVAESIDPDRLDEETVQPVDLAMVIALGLACVRVSKILEGWTGLPAVLTLTTLALVLAQTGPVQRLRGTRVAGMVTVMLFLAVIGALCDVAALGRLGELAGTLVVFVTIVVGVHGLVVFGGAAILRLDPAAAAVASQANIGGSTTALALARSLARPDLVLPGILVGALGNLIGNYLGLLVAQVLARLA